MNNAAGLPLGDRLLAAAPLLIAIAEGGSFAAASERLDVDPNQARRLLGQLEEAGIATHASDGRRNRVWRVDQMFKLLDDHSLGRS